MENSQSHNPRSCWTQCFWCFSTCNGRRLPKVAPLDPFPTISIDGKKANEDLETFKSRIQLQRDQPKREIENGNINLFYVPDETGDVPDAYPRIKLRGEKDSSNEPEESYLLQHSIFIEIAKDKRIRVVHLDPKTVPNNSTANKTTEDIPSPNAAVQSTPSPNPAAQTNQRKSIAEEEDEYWFMKWTRKPRFRSIFEKNTIHGSQEDEDEATENNNSPQDGTLSKDFELARSAAAAKRRAWAYNNGGSEPVVQHCTSIEDEQDEEFNSIVICDTLQKWSKNKSEHSGAHNFTNTNEFVNTTKTPPNTPARNNSSAGVEDGITNLAFEGEDNQEPEVVREMAVDCPPDFISPTKNLSLKRGMSSPSSTNGITTPAAVSSYPKRYAQPPSHSPQLSDRNTNASFVLDDGVETEATLRQSSPIIFLIHGISGSVDVWKAQMEFFQNLGYEIVAPDLLGHGFSSAPDVPKYYQFDSLAQDLLGVYDYFVQDGRKVVLVGHGYGSCLGAVISRVRPKSSRLLISISGGGPTPLVNRSCCRSSLLPFYCKLFHMNPTQGRFDNPELRHILPSVIHKHIVNGQTWPDGDSGFYRRISLPTLLVYGMKDKVVNLVEICEMERTIPKSFLEVIESGGHMLMLDEPTKLNKMLGKFIQSWV